MMRALAHEPPVDALRSDTRRSASGGGGLSRIAFPFLTTSPIQDVGFLFLLLPVWWVVGAEQFVWTVGLTWIWLRQLASSQFRIKLSAPACWLLVFMAAQVLSAVFISDAARWITFFRTFSTYIAAFLIVTILGSRVLSREEIETILRRALWGFAWSLILGTLAFAGVWQPEFRSLVGSVMPDWIASTSYGARIAERRLGAPAWFIVIGDYFRLEGFFLFATLYGIALVVMMPVVLFLVRYSSHWLRRAVSGFLLLAAAVNLLGTTARVPILAGMCGWGAYLLSRLSGGWKVSVAVAAMTAGVLVAVSPAAALFRDAVEAAAVARGGGSLGSRTDVYIATWEGFTDNPVFGWGTERDVPGLPYPAGSHSYYFGVLYKHGLLGFGALFGLLVAIWRGSRVPGAPPANPEQTWLKRFLQYGRWSTATVILCGTTDAIDLDASTMALIWLIFALLLAARRSFYRGFDIIAPTGGVPEALPR